jgi:hypothetical protein
MSTDSTRNQDLAETLNRLVDTLEERDRRHRRALSIHRGLLGLLLALIAGLLLQGQAPMRPALAEADTPVELTPEIRARIREWDRELAAVKAALAESEEFEIGVMIAWFLGQVANSMEYMPQMTAEMQRMNQHMAAVPVMATEMRQLNNNMAIMTYGVDRTMGNMGRMMPFMW